MSPLESAIQFLRITLLGETSPFDAGQGPAPSDPGNVPVPVDPPFISPLPPQYQPPPDLGVPDGGFGIFPLPPTNPGSGGISVLPPFNPIGPYNPPGTSPSNNVPANIAYWLGGGT